MFVRNNEQSQDFWFTFPALISTLCFRNLELEGFAQIPEYRNIFSEGA